VSTNSSVEHFFSPRTAGDKTSFAVSAVIDLGVYGADGFTIAMDQTKRDTIPSIDPSLNHTTIYRLAENINDYELVVHPGDFAYADDWYLKPKNLLDGVDAYEAILEQFYDQLAPIAGRKAYMARYVLLSAVVPRFMSSTRLSNWKNGEERELINSQTSCLSC
jgi:hypothetical protein